MSNKPYIQAVLHRQGKNALKGDINNLSDVEVQRKGFKRLARNAGGTALAGAAIVGTLAFGLGKQESADHARTTADKAAYGKLMSSDLAPHFAGAVSTDVETPAQTTESSTSTADLAALPTTGGIPAAETVTPATTPGSSNQESVVSQSGGIAAGEMPASPSGGISPDSPTSP